MNIIPSNLRLENLNSSIGENHKSEQNACRHNLRYARQLANDRKSRKKLNEENVTLILHAGDYISPFVIPIFKALNAKLDLFAPVVWFSQLVRTNKEFF